MASSAAWSEPYCCPEPTLSVTVEASTWISASWALAAGDQSWLAANTAVKIAKKDLRKRQTSTVLATLLAELLFRQVALYVIVSDSRDFRNPYRPDIRLEVCSQTTSPNQGRGKYQTARLSRTRADRQTRDNVPSVCRECSRWHDPTETSFDWFYTCCVRWESSFRRPNGTSQFLY